MKVLFLLIAVFCCCELSKSQDYGDEGYGQDNQYYQDYADDGYGQPDNLYADYASGKAEKAAGGGWLNGKTLALGAASWIIGGKIHSKRAVAKLKKKHQKDQKALYTQYYKDVYALQQENAELLQYVNQIATQQQDAEFIAADVDKDNKVSRAEFNMYRNAYLQNHPEMADQFPAFESFDPDKNGFISKAEYDAYYRKLQGA